MGQFIGHTTLTGYGVVRNAPWHFAGLYSTKEAADAEAARLGPEYAVHWGDHAEGTDDFIWSEPAAA